MNKDDGLAIFLIVIVIIAWIVRLFIIKCVMGG